MPKIIESDDNVLDYTALTYCWGNANIQLTTTANLSERMRCLRWDCLPYVFKDAIILTRAVGIKYIWIDAICILQDDPADMSRQLGLMDRIYHEAFLVISADSATSANDRLFQERRGSLHLRTKSRIPSIKDSEVLLYEGINHGFLAGRGIADYGWPLATRAWTLQERFLASRIIHISADELVWECNEKLRCECKYMDQTGRNRKGWDLDVLTWSSLRLRYINHLGVDTSDDQKAECWCYILREYSGRLCSVDVDRLPAISGLARRFGTACNSEYRAGIWTKHVLRMISWHRTPDDICRRPSEYTAPSWSWASIIGSIDWEFSEYWDFGHSIPDKADFVAQVVDIDCRLCSNDPFGRVSSGHLTLSSPTLTVATRESEDGGRELDLGMRHTLIMDVNSLKGDSELPKTGFVICIFLEVLRGWTTSALVVKPCSSVPGRYQRIGRLFVHDWEKIPKLTTEILTIQ
jgi:hypothetical protein